MSDAHIKFAILSAILAILAWFGLRTAGLPDLGAYLAGITLVTFVMYGADKLQAKRGKERVPELIFHALALVGGTIGAIVGQTAFRHKTVDKGFRAIFYVIIVIQVFVVGAYFTRRYWQA